MRINVIKWRSSKPAGHLLKRHNVVLKKLFEWEMGVSTGPQGTDWRRLKKKTEMIDFRQATRIVFGVKTSEEWVKYLSNNKASKKERRRYAANPWFITGGFLLFGVYFFPRLWSRLNAKSARSGGEKIRYKFTSSMPRMNSGHVWRKCVGRPGLHAMNIGGGGDRGRSIGKGRRSR